MKRFTMNENTCPKCGFELRFVIDSDLKTISCTCCSWSSVYSLSNSFPELKPCPFCGGHPELQQCDGPLDENEQPESGWVIRCLCDSGEIHVQTVWHQTVESVCNAWNKRA